MTQRHWNLWGRVVVRTAGFSADGISELARLSGNTPTSGNEIVAEASPDYQAELLRSTRTIQKLFRDLALGDAVAQQNPDAWMFNIEPYLHWDPEVQKRKAVHRKWESLAVSYLQRYLMKNDTIGFFGPVGWGFIDEDSQNSIAFDAMKRPETPNHKVFFEGWVMERAAERLRTVPNLWRYLTPWLGALVELKESHVLFAGDRSISLGSNELASLQLVDGIRKVHEIATLLDRDELSVYQSFQAMERRRLLHLGPFVPSTPWPEIALSRFTESITDELVRDNARSVLAGLSAVRENIGSGIRGEISLHDQIENARNYVLDELQSTTSDKNAGRAYGGRGIYYTDTARDGNLIIGRDVTSVLEPLELLADSARWMTSNVARVVEERLLQIWRGNAVSENVGAFWFRCLPHVLAAVDAESERLRSELHRKWQTILRYTSGDRRCEYQSADIQQKVESEFRVDRAGWAGARFFSPDVLISRDESTGLVSGAVVGEAHVAINTQRAWCFRTQESPEAAAERERMQLCDDPHLVVTTPKQSWPRLGVRNQNADVRAVDYCLEITNATSDPSRPKRFRAADVVVHRKSDGLAVVFPDGHEFKVIELFSELLMSKLIDSLTLCPAGAHAPRIAIDRLVIQRERWRFPSDELTFTSTRDEAERFARVGAWAHRLGLPAQVFIKKDGEKPYFVDFNSLPLVTLFCRVARSIALDGYLHVSEALPTKEQYWLRDVNGASYSSELRLTLVDDSL